MPAAAEDKNYLFEKMPVSRAVVALVVPTVISQVINVIYNMADTFFVGQLNDPNQVAAASLCVPMFLFCTCVANLFGIGGSSHISRSLGEGNPDKARKISSFCILTASGAAVLYGLVLHLVKPWLLPMVGADEATYEFCSRYLFWVVTVGALPTVVSAVMAHLIRAEGCSKQASFGIAMGGVLNIFLDPLFISVLKLQIAGAAIATMISNTVSLVYFIFVQKKRRSVTVINARPKNYTLGLGIPKEVVLVGLPSCFITLFGTVSNVFMNRFASSFCNESVAGLGIAKKVDLLSTAIGTGMAQGVLPLVGYNYSSGNFPRMRESIRKTLVYSLSVTTVSAAVLYFFAGSIVKAFIDDPLTVSYGQMYQKIICITGPCVAAAMLMITVFQAAGKKVQPLFLSMLRKGVLDIPAMFLLVNAFGEKGLVWATPIADFGVMLFSAVLFIPFIKKLRKKESAVSQN